MLKRVLSIYSFLFIMAAGLSPAHAAGYGDPVFEKPLYATQAGAGYFHVTDQIIDIYGDGDGDGKPDVIETKHNVNVDVIQGPDQDWSGPAGIQPGKINYANFLGAPNQETSGWGGAAGGGSLIIGFDEDFVDGEGQDFMVHGFGFGFNKAFSDERGTVNIYVADASYNPIISGTDPVTGLVSITGDETKWKKISGWTGRDGSGTWVGNPDFNYASGVGKYCKLIGGDLASVGLASARYIKIELGDGGHYIDDYNSQPKQNNGRAFFVDAVETRGYTAAPVNNPPVLKSIKNQSIDEGANLRIAISATDPDGDAITYSLTSNPAITGATFDKTTGVFSWTPGPGTKGIYTITFTATDNGDPVKSDAETIKVTVGKVNHPPEFVDNNPAATYAGLEEELISFKVSATDQDGNSLNYTATNLPEGAKFSGQSFTWKTGYEDAGRHTITFTVTDNGEPKASASRTVTITIGNKNRAPEFEKNKPEAAYAVKTGELLTFQVSATDPDDDQVSYTASNLPGGAKFSGQTFAWQTEDKDKGSYTITFKAADKGAPSKSVSKAVTINVNKGAKSGDIDGNGVVDLKDALLVLKILTGEKVPSVDIEADVDNDKKINIIESVHILKDKAGKDARKENGAGDGKK